MSKNNNGNPNNSLMSRFGHKGKRQIVQQQSLNYTIQSRPTSCCRSITKELKSNAENQKLQGQASVLKEKHVKQAQNEKI